MSASSGIYYQLPPYTALGYKDASGVLVNRDLKYMRVFSNSAGFDWRWKDRLIVSLQGFYKAYSDIPLSLRDDIPLTCKGNDYGTVGDEPLVSTAQGRAYGVEAMVKWQIPGKLNVIGSATLYNSEYRNNARAPYIASAWDNRFVVNLSGRMICPGTGASGPN